MTPRKSKLSPLGEKLEARRIGHLTKDKLCDEAGISRPTYDNIINGVSEPTIQTLKKIADFYGIDYKTLLP